MLNGFVQVILLLIAVIFLLGIAIIIIGLYVSFKVADEVENERGERDNKD